jgi:hypothetical protein
VAGGYVDVKFNQRYTINTDVSPVYLLAVLDSANAISEANEVNNVILSEPVR